DAPSRDLNVEGLREPGFEVEVEAFGYLEAHLMPTLSFGIQFDDHWKVEKCTAELVADGFVTLRAKSSIVGGDCGFAYAVDAGAAIVARANVPSSFQWKPAPFTIGSIERNLIPGDGSDWKCLTGGSTRRSSDGMGEGPSLRMAPEDWN